MEWLSPLRELSRRPLAFLFLLIPLLFGIWPPSVAAAFTATQLGDYDNVTVMQVSGSYDVAYLNGSPDLSARRTIAKEFYRTHGDDYDMLVIFTNFDFAMPPGAKAFFSTAKNDVRGIGVKLSGQELYDHTNAYSPTGSYLARLNGTIDMANIASHMLEPADPQFDDTLMTLTHEFMHRWGAYVRFRDGAVDSDVLLGAGDAHWSYLLDSKGSTLYGNHWRDNGDGTFTSIAPEQIREGAVIGRILSPLDLYLMGLVDKSKVPPLLLIDAPGIDRHQLPAIGDTIPGVAKTVTIDDIIAAEGARVPAFADVRKEFRVAFIYAVTPGSWSAGDAQDRGEVAAINRLQMEWEKRFSILTDGTAMMRTAMVVPEAVESNPGVTAPSVTPAVTPSVNSGVNWLVSRQQPGGYWQDQPGTDRRDTAAAVAALKAFPAGVAAAASGQAWLGTVTPENSDFLARKLLGLNSASAVDLIALQNVDGGWGSAPGYASAPVDTALVLQALTARGGAGSAVLTAAVNCLHASQNPDGGWNVGRGGSMVQSTARVLLALNSHRGSYPLEPAIADGLAWLSTRQNGDGGFGNSPSTVIDTSLALQALKATGTTPTAANSAVSYLLARQGSAGSWNDSVFQTAQAVEALYAGQVAADLSVATADISFNPLLVVAVPSPVTVTVTVRNLGSSAASTVRVALFDNDPSLGNLLGEQTLNVPGNGSVPATFSVIVERPGLHDYYATVDDNHQIAESNEWNNTASKTLAANMAPPAVGFALPASAGSEAVTSVPIAVNLSYPWPAPITVNYAVNAASTAAPSADYTLAAGTLTFAADQTSKTINLAVVNDLVAEVDKTVVIDFSAPSVGTLGTAKHSYTIRDDEPPAVTITSPPGGLIGQNTPQLLYTSTGGNVTVKVDGVVVGKVVGDTLGPLVDGAHFVEVTATNSLGMVTASRVDFNVDTALPTVAILSPLPGVTTNARPMLGYIVTSAARVDVLVDGVAVNLLSGNLLGPLSDGVHSITVNAWNAGGAKSSTQVDFRVDARPPQVTIVYPRNEYIRENNPALRCRADEDGQVAVWLNGIETSFSVGQPVGPLSSGTHRLRVTMTDSVGNIGTDEVVFAVSAEDEEAYVPDTGWPKNIGATYGGIAADRAGNLYVVTRRAEKELDIAKYDPAGQQLWRAIMSSYFNVDGGIWVDIEPKDMAIDSLGNIYVVGWGHSISKNYSVLAKYDSTGKYINHVLFDAHMLYSNVQIFSVYIDSNDYVYISGNTNNNFISANYQDSATMFVAKYNQNLNRLYGRCFGKSNDPTSFSFVSRDSMTVDEGQNVFITGKNGNNEMLVWKLAPDLTRTGVEVVGPYNAYGTDIDADLSGNIYVAGKGSSGGTVGKYSSEDGRLIVMQGPFAPAGFSSLIANQDGSVIVADDAGTVRKLDNDFAELWSTSLGGDCDSKLVLSATGQLFVGGSDTSYNATSIAGITDPRLPRFNFSKPDFYANGNPVILSGYLDPAFDVALQGERYVLLGYSHESTDGYWQMVVDDLLEGENRLAVSVANDAGFVKQYEARVVVDTIAPQVTIDMPSNGSVWTSKPWLSYVVSEGEVSVFVNGVEVTQKSGFQLDSLRLGENRIRVQSIDPAGNLGFKEIVIQAAGTAVGEYPLAINGMQTVEYAGSQSVVDTGEDAAGNLYVFGEIENSGLYVAKFGAEGNLLDFWPLDGGDGYVSGAALVVKPAGEFSIAYTTHPFNTPYVTSMHVASFAANGLSLWSDILSTGGNDRINDLAVDGAGNFFACGETEGRLNNKKYGGNGDYFLVKYTPQGSRLWTVLSNAPTMDSLKTIVLADDGFLYGMGRMTDAAAMTLFKFDLSGARLWTKDYKYPNSLMAAQQMKRGFDGSFYTFIESQDSTAPYYYFVAKHDPQGNFVNGVYGQGAAIRGFGMSLDASSNVFVTGYSDDPYGLGWSFGGNRSFGDEDIFIAKYSSADLRMLWSEQAGDVKGQQGGAIIFSRVSDRAYLAGIEDADLASGGNSGDDLFLAPLTQLTERSGPGLTVDSCQSPTRHRFQSVTGSATLGAIVAVSVAAPTASTAKVSSVEHNPLDSTWSFTVSNLVADADNVLTVSATDSVGTTSKSVTIKVDTLPPSLTVNPVASPTYSASQVFAGTAEAGASLTVEINPPATVTPVAVVAGTWSTPATLFAGDNSLVFTATDAAGNTTVRTATITLLPPRLTVFPTTIQQGEPATVTLTIEQFDSAAPDIQIKVARDMAGDGSPTNDPLVRLFLVKDGVVSNNPNVPGDEDGLANGRIVTTLYFDYLNDVQMAPGDYVFVANTYPVAVTVPFRIVAASQTQTIQGYVLDPQNTPRGGATVQLLDKWGRSHGYAFTDAAGHYLFNVPAPGEYLLLPTLGGFVFAKTNLVTHPLAIGQNLNVDLSMVAGTHLVDGQVRDAGTLSQIPGGILVRAENSQYVAAPMTSAHGTYAVHLPAGDYDLFADAYTSQGASAQGYLGARKSLGHVAVSAASPGNNLQLNKVRSLVCGQVRDPENMGVAGLVIEATTNSGTGRFATAVTDDAGNYCLGLMDDGIWQIVLNDAADQVQGYVGNTVAGITATSGPFNGVDLAVYPIEGMIEGTVREDGVRAVAGVSVKATCAATGAIVTNRTAADGSYRLGVHAGTWQVAIAAEPLGYNPVAPVSAAVDAGGATSRNFAVSKPVQPVNTIAITKAAYDTRKKVLIVQATSNHANAQLQVVDYGPMTYSKLTNGKYYWTFTKSLPSKPLNVTVSGPEGAKTATVQ